MSALLDVLDHVHQVDGRDRAGRAGGRPRAPSRSPRRSRLPSRPCCSTAWPARWTSRTRAWRWWRRSSARAGSSRSHVRRGVEKLKALSSLGPCPLPIPRGPRAPARHRPPRSDDGGGGRLRAGPGHLPARLGGRSRAARSPSPPSPALAALLPAPVAWVGKLIIDGVVEAARSGSPDARAGCTAGRSSSWPSWRPRWWPAGSWGCCGSSCGPTSATASTGRSWRRRSRWSCATSRTPTSTTRCRTRGGRPPRARSPCVMQAFGVAQNLVTLTALSALLWRLSPWSVLVIVAASIPAFVAEARLSAESFRVNTWRAPEGRRLNYLEWILTRDSHVKEVKLFDLGPLVLGRYRELFRSSTRRTGASPSAGSRPGSASASCRSAAFYGMYLLVAARAARGEISLGDLTLYLVVFRQGQAAFQAVLTAVGAMYEDALFMSNLFAFLAIPTSGERARIDPPATAPARRARSPSASRTSPSATRPAPEWALRDVNLRLAPGETLGLVGRERRRQDHPREAAAAALRPDRGARSATAASTSATSIRATCAAASAPCSRTSSATSSPPPRTSASGSPAHVEDRPRIAEAARRAGASSVVEALPRGLDTVLGRLVRGGPRALRRPVAEAGGGPGLHARRRAAGPRRADRHHRRRGRARALRALPGAGRGPDRHRHLPPLLDRPDRRPDRRPPRRPARGAGQPPGAARPGRTLRPPLLAAGRRATWTR